MRRVLDVLRLTFDQHRSQREVAQSLGLSQGSVHAYLTRFAASGLAWPVPSTMTAAEFEARLFQRPALPPGRPLPDWPTVRRELTRKGVTLQLLWGEYKAQYPDGYQYTQFCRHYRAWAATLEPVLRQVYVAGERAFVDYAGPTLPLVDPTTGEERRAAIFVGALGASHLLYTEATETQTLPDWIGAQVRMLESFGGVPALLIPDQAAALVRRPCSYEPELHPTYQDFAAHYGTTILPARLATVRSERQLMERIDYDLMFRWFVGLELDDPVWDVTVFTTNRDRLLEGEIAQAFFQAVLAEARQQHLLSPEHFTIDGTLVRAWAGQKSFRRRRGQRPPPRDDDPGNPTVDFHGERRSNATHPSTTDPDARLSRKGAGHEAQLAYHGHVLMENRHGLAVGAVLTPATGTAERDAVGPLLRHGPRRRGRRTLGADKAYDTRGAVAAWRTLGVTPHVAQNTGRRGGSAIDARTTRHPGYAVSQHKRKRIEEIFGWLKTIGLQRQTRFRGTARVAWMFVFATAAYNLVRMHRLLATSGVP